MKVKNLYHKKVYWKRHFDKAVQKLITDKVRVSDHIKIDNQKIAWCGHNKIELNKLLAITYDYVEKKIGGYLFEVETEYDTKTKVEVITKAVFRTEFNKEKDIVIVVRKNTIITAWLQDKNDKHSTLDSSKYWKPKKF